MAAQNKTREHLLDVGERIVRNQGFSSAGLAEILSEAEVPKGSFYHYFSSKESYGVALLERYFVRSVEDMRRILEQPNRSTQQAILDYFSAWKQRIEDSDCRQGCFAVKLTAEVSDLSEPMRQTLMQGRQHMVRILAEHLDRAQCQPSELLAEALYALWCGADLAARANHDHRSLLAALWLTQQCLEQKSTHLLTSQHDSPTSRM